MGPNAILLRLAESVANTIVPAILFKRTELARGFATTNKGKDYDDEIRKLKSEHLRSAGRAAQMVYQLRCIMAHPSKSHGQSQREDILAFLDVLSFLSNRVKDSPDLQSDPDTKVAPQAYLALDGDDVGRRFESLLVCGDVDVTKVREWSYQMHCDVSRLMSDLMTNWDALPLASTGDSFLASFPQRNIKHLLQAFRPMVSEGTVSTGIGLSMKEAYLALKLCKAGNRGGGVYYSVSPPTENIVWTAHVASN